MTKIDDGGPAFATGDQVNGGQAGMSLREYYAGQALPAIIAATSAGQHQPSIRESDTHIVFAIARDAYFMADAMLAARAEKTGGER